MNAPSAGYESVKAVEVSGYVYGKATAAALSGWVAASA